MTSVQHHRIDQMAAQLGQGALIQIARAVATADGDDSQLHTLNGRTVTNSEADIIIAELEVALTKQ